MVGIHRPYGTGNNDVCNISSNSNAEVPMPRFANGRYFANNQRLVSWAKIITSNNGVE